MKTSLAYASNCSDALYSFIYKALQQRSGAENESLYQQAISACRTPKQKRKWPVTTPVRGRCCLTPGVTTAYPTLPYCPCWHSSAYPFCSAKN